MNETETTATLLLITVIGVGAWAFWLDTRK